MYRETSLVPDIALRHFMNDDRRWKRRWSTSVHGHAVLEALEAIAKVACFINVHLYGQYTKAPEEHGKRRLFHS